MDGFEAFRVCQDFQIILMDLHMPGLTGYEVTRKILERNPTCYIIALTAHCSAEHQRRAYEIGMREFLSKPLTVSVLKEAMWRALQEVKRHE